MKNLNHRSLKITFSYAAVGFVYIFVSDFVLAVFIKDAALYADFQTVKGFIFIIITALLLFILVRNNLKEYAQVEKQFLQSQKMETMGMLAGGIAHDFNNILTVILGNINLALMSLNKESESIDVDELKNYLNDVQDGAFRAEKMIEKLLAFSRKREIKPKIIKANEEIRKQFDMFKRLVPENIELNAELCEEDADILIDPGNFTQILFNLVVNAKDAIEAHPNPDAKKIAIKTRKINIADDQYVSSIELKLKAGNYLVISVADSGIGIPKNIQGKIFEPFFTTKGPNAGTGLGLPVIQKITKDNKGSVTFRSAPKKGTTFNIILPIVIEINDLTRKSKKSQTKSIETYRGNEVILLAEDDPKLTKVIRKSLQRLGYNITDCINGKEALDVFKKEKNFDLVLTDLIMPIIDGKSLSKQILDIHDKQNILVMTGYVHETNFKGENLFFIDKPFGILSLSQKIRQILDRKNENKNR